MPDQRSVLTTAQRNSLSAFLESSQNAAGVRTIRQLEGFLFAVCCSPEMILPNEWLLAVLGNPTAPGGANHGGSQAALDAMLALHDAINDNVMDGAAALPPDCVPLEPASANLQAGSSLSAWATGFDFGRGWADDFWPEELPEEEEEELGACLMVLSFFAENSDVARLREEVAGEAGKTVDEFCQVVVDMFPAALKNYAAIGAEVAARSD